MMTSGDAVSRPMISLREVSKTYGDSASPAVECLSLEILSGEIVVLVGPSGCGKTTVLKMINRLVEPTSGYIEVNGAPVRDGEPHLLRRSIGYVIQQVGAISPLDGAAQHRYRPRAIGMATRADRGTHSGIGRAGGFGRVAARSLSGCSVRRSAAAGRGGSGIGG